MLKLRALAAASLIIIATISPRVVEADQGLQPQQARDADAFVDAVGVNTHFDYNDTPYVMEYARVRALLLASGIRHIRDGDVTTRADYAGKLSDFGHHGIKHSLSFNVGLTPAKMQASLRFFAPYTEFVEPMNEYDGYRQRDPHWPATIADEQRLLYKTVRADPANDGIAIVGPPLAQQKWYTLLGHLDDSEDAGNLHNAPCWFAPETTKKLGVVAMTDLVRTSTVTKPIWTTETGYNDNPAQHCSLPDQLIAKYDPRTVAERFLAGEPRVYFYEFTDVPNDPVFGHFGLVDAEGFAKPQYTSMASLIAALSDPGPPFAARPLSYALSGNTSNVRQLLLQKRDGEYDLLMWQAVDGWASGPDNFGGSLLNVTPVRLTVTAPETRAVGVLAYDQNYELRPASFEATGDSTTVNVEDSITILRLKRSRTI